MEKTRELINAEEALALATDGAKAKFVEICETGVDASLMISEFNKITSAIKWLQEWVEYYNARDNGMDKQGESKADS